MSGKIPVATLKAVKALQQKKFRDQEGLFVAEGDKVVHEALDSGAVIESLFGQSRPEWLPDDHPFTEASTKDLERMSGMKSAPGLLAVIKKPAPVLALPSSGLVLALDGIRDPGNLGTIIRTAEWFGVEAILCSEDCVESTNPKVVQASMGSLFRVNIITGELPLMLEKLRGAGFPVYRAEMQGKDALSHEFDARAVIVTGSESHGIRFDSVDTSLSIPSFGNAESLNASVATAVILSAYRRQHRPQHA